MTMDSIDRQVLFSDRRGLLLPAIIALFFLWTSKSGSVRYASQRWNEEEYAKVFFQGLDEDPTSSNHGNDTCIFRGRGNVIPIGRDEIFLSAKNERLSSEQVHPLWQTDADATAALCWLALTCLEFLADRYYFQWCMGADEQQLSQTPLVWAWKPWWNCWCWCLDSIGSSCNVWTAAKCRLYCWHTRLDTWLRLSEESP